MFELNQINSGKIMDESVGFKVKLFMHFMKISWEKDGNFERMSLLISILLWNLKLLPKCLPIKNNGISFQSWKLSSENLFTQENCKSFCLAQDFYYTKNEHQVFSWFRYLDYTFHATESHLNPIQNTNTHNFTFCLIRF